MMQLSDEFLLAYLDGQLEKAQTAEVSGMAAANAEVSRRVERLKRTQAQLIETLGALAREEIEIPRGALQPESAPAHPAATKQQIQAAKAKPAEPQAKRPSVAWQLFFICAVFASGVAGGYGATLFAPPRPVIQPKAVDRLIVPESWSADIANFHSFFPKEMLTPHPEAIANPEFIRFQLSKITAKALTPPDFSRQGFSLYRGQSLKYRQDNMMQLTFSSKTEPPLTLYVLPADGYSDSLVRSQSFGSYKAVSWVSDRVRYFLTAEKNEEDLKVLAVIAQSQMPHKP
jgi:anti-sigma factor RsiW